MRYVYLLESMQDPEQFYVGSTNDLPRRLAEHNNGKGRLLGRDLLPKKPGPKRREDN
jgi:predicted GIY-YIG superfamily endonuclease